MKEYKQHQATSTASSAADHSQEVVSQEAAFALSKYRFIHHRAAGVKRFLKQISKEKCCSADNGVYNTFLNQLREESQLWHQRWKEASQQKHHALNA